MIIPKQLSFHQDFTPRINSSLQRSVSLGEVVQTRGFGGTARFTLPGMEDRRRKGQDKTLLAGKVRKVEKEEGKNEPRTTAREEAGEKNDKEDSKHKTDEAVEKSILEVAED